MSGISALIYLDPPESDSLARTLLWSFRLVARDCGGEAVITPLGPLVQIRADFPSSEHLPDPFVALMNKTYNDAQRPGEIAPMATALWDYSSGCPKGLIRLVAA
jgi:hypothetical protein